jgi:hypothetical protein
MRIQRASGPDLEYTEDTVGALVKIVVEYAKHWQFLYKGHFIIRHDGKAVF